MHATLWTEVFTYLNEYNSANGVSVTVLISTMFRNQHRCAWDIDDPIFVPCRFLILKNKVGVSFDVPHVY